MDPVEALEKILEGNLAGLVHTGPRARHAADQIASRIGLGEGKLPLPRVERLLGTLHGRGRFLCSLVVLKVVAARSTGNSDLIPLLESLMEDESLYDATEALTTDPLASEFLGSDRPPVAWSVLLRDRLELHAASPPGDPGVPDEWVICRDEKTTSSDAPHGVVLAWRTTTTVPGKIRPAGHRKICRKKISLKGVLTVLGPSMKGSHARRLKIRIVDISPAGLGLTIPNPHAVLDVSDFQKRRVRLDVALPADGRRIATLANVAWCVATGGPADASIRVGVQFHEPPPEVVQAIKELIIQRKGDQQLLWNLWDVQAPKG